VDYPAAAFRRMKEGIRIGRNRFGEKGIFLAVNTPKLTISGKHR
jgi:hypothetical protein